MNSPLPNPDRDLLISRIVDGSASDADWGAMDDLAQNDAAVWRDLAQAQRHHAELTSAVSAALAFADRTPLPEAESYSFQAYVRSRLSPVARWAGWAAAAALALVTVGSRMGFIDLRSPRTMTSDGTQAAGLGGSINDLVRTPAEALQAYYEKGQDAGLVLGEMPSKLMLEVVPVADQPGGYEVYYVRQIIERARVTDLYQFSHGEGGQVQMIPARVPAAKHTGSY